MNVHAGITFPGQKFSKSCNKPSEFVILISKGELLDVAEKCFDVRARCEEEGFFAQSVGLL